MKPRVKIQSRRCWHQEMAKCVGVFATTTTTTNDHQRPLNDLEEQYEKCELSQCHFRAFSLLNLAWPGMPPSWIFTFLLHALPWVVPSLSHCTLNSTFRGCFSNDEKQLEKMPTTTAGCKLKHLFVYVFSISVAKSYPLLFN